MAFADESGTSKISKCYTIGVICVRREKLNEFNKRFQELMKSHQVQGELKWTHVRNSHGTINCILDLLKEIIQTDGITFDAIVVNKQLYRNWQGGSLQQETAFYKTYTQLLRHIARRSRDTAEVFIDNRSDNYPKQHEVVETIGNYMLAKLHSSGRLKLVQKVNSSTMPGIQIADVITGAINSSHLRYLDSRTSINKGKTIAINRMAQMLGWDDLCYDTMPHPKFNIWHFPIEYRTKPKTKALRFNNIINYVKPNEL
jgi:hypothetical protein